MLAAIIDSSDDAIVSKDLTGIVTSWNKSAERIFGYTAAEMIGHPILLLLPNERRDEEIEILAKIRRGERLDHFETIRRRKDGQLIDVSVTISPVHNAEGEIVGASKVARDITEQRRASEAGLLLAAIVNSSDDAIVSKNLNSIITSWNAAAQRIFGYTPEEAIGQSVVMLVPADRRDEEPRILERLRRGERVDHFETVRVRKNGELIPVSLTISPVKDATGRVIGASKIARDISEIKRLASERDQLLQSERAARSQAENANRQKDDFLATVSHELRTPLNAIVGWTQVLKESAGNPDEVQEAITIIERSAQAQAQLIDDLLDLGRITSGKMTLDVQPIEIGTVVQDAIAAVQRTADLKGIRLRTIINSGGGAMMGDKQRLQQVLWNLLANSIKFTPKGGHVVVTVARVNSQMEIAVADTGRGITADFLPHVFERFRQADASTTRQQGGLGIGLALVKHLVELHGGSVLAESPGLERGATFTIALPVQAAHAAVDLAESTVSAPVESRPSEDLSGIKVLAVDDDRDSLHVVKRILVSRHAEVEIAASAEEAWKIFPMFRPDVVLSDIGMPGHDGYEFIRRIRQFPGGSSVPAAALTALARSDDRMRALHAGFQTHVAKPIAPNELVAVVRSLAALRPAAPAGTGRA